MFQCLRERKIGSQQLNFHNKTFMLVNFSTLVAGYLLATILLSGCYSKKQIYNSGIVVYKQRIRSLESSEEHTLDFARDARILFRNNFVIEERSAASFETDSTGKTTVKTSIDRYTFINLLTKEHYVYRNFSDTAIPIRNFSHPDSIKADGGWDFFNLKKAIFDTGGTRISDSIMKGVRYKRIIKDTAYTSNSAKDTVRHIAYLRCDKKNTFIYLQKQLSELHGCPTVRTDWINLKTKAIASFEIEFVSDKINSEENKVFDAWERKAIMK
jgi:hypothetical protein